MKKIFRKLKTEKGESITEVLIALLVSCIALAMLAVAVQSSTKILLKSEAAAEGYYSRNNDLANFAGASEDAAVSIKNGGVDVNLVPGEDSIEVKLFTNDYTKQNVMTYRAK